MSDTHSHTLFFNFGGSYLIWRASLAITLGGIWTQFPSKTALFHLKPKQVCRCINSDKNYPYTILGCFKYSPYPYISNLVPFGESWNPLESWLVKLEFFPICAFIQISIKGNYSGIRAWSLHLLITTINWIKVFIDVFVS